MKREDINIRDPYVLVSGGKYYLYGTRSATTWAPVGGLDVYVSDDLENFDGPIEIIPEKEYNFWAPECYELDGRYYLVVTVLSDKFKKGIYIYDSNQPTGPFELYSKRLTPDNWTCIDGTLYFENDECYLVFSHSFEDAKEGGSIKGDYARVRLSKDLKEAASEPEVMFSSSDAVWAKPVPFAKAEFGIDGDVYFSDGPAFVDMTDGNLYMIFSSWSIAGYAVGVASSENGIAGPWKLQAAPLYPENGGHGMLFKDLKDKLVFALHYPNDKYKERPIFCDVKLEEGCLKLK